MKISLDNSKEGLLWSDRGSSTGQYIYLTDGQRNKTVFEFGHVIPFSGKWQDRCESDNGSPDPAEQSNPSEDGSENASGHASNGG